jgi:hypothetical protein
MLEATVGIHTTECATNVFDVIADLLNIISVSWF